MLHDIMSKFHLIITTIITWMIMNNVANVDSCLGQWYLSIMHVNLCISSKLGCEVG